MCVVCTMWEKGKLTEVEAANAYAEIGDTTEDPNTAEHATDKLKEMIQKAIKDLLLW